MTMKPEFVKAPVWLALPENIQEAILDEGAILFRKGADPQDAFWTVLERQSKFVEDLHTFFDVGNPPRGIQWASVNSEESKVRRASLNALLRGFYLAHTGHEEFREFKETDDLLAFMLEGRPRHRCSYCFQGMGGPAVGEVGSLRVHSRCKPKLMTLGDICWDIIDDECQKSQEADLDAGPDEAELEYPEFLSIFADQGEDVG